VTIIYDYVTYSCPVYLSLFSTKYQSEAYENKSDSKKHKVCVYIVCLFQIFQVSGLVLKIPVFILG
jgi:hypothetical protein